ncbi:glycoside hydrolase family 1 protein [Microbacterium hominis]|uniref:glycoside hydrolase family 1 protein n=1 Tax=Microbacterium hominis TaxID=162426 RepID=UPI0020B8CE45|nr:family 1 glycosylhydrolase [Microbacterium hominis]
MTQIDGAFPEGFLWGAATSAHQTEGENTNSNWWHLETAPNSPFAERSGAAVDSYRRYPEDMRLLADAGLDTYRFSIEWARIEPTQGEFDTRELEHYRSMIDTAIGLGLTPVVTLHHFTTPMWFAQRGGWASPDAVDRFAAYVTQASTILADVPWICTINEPNMIALLTGMPERVAATEEQDATLDSRPIAALALPTPSDDVTRVLTEAHRRAVDILRAATDAKVGWTVSAQGFEAEPGAESVFTAVKWAWEDRYLEVSRDDDFVGVQSYTTRKIGLDGPVAYTSAEEQTMTGWPFRPDAVGLAVRNAWSVTGGTPVLVTENGIATADDRQRIAYVEGALHSLAAAIADGIDVRGYLHWSALDNYEWGEWGPTFGLIAVDRETFERTPRPSLAWLGARAHAARAASGRPVLESVEAS